MGLLPPRIPRMRLETTQLHRTLVGLARRGQRTPALDHAGGGHLTSPHRRRLVQ